MNESSYFLLNYGEFNHVEREKSATPFILLHWFLGRNLFQSFVKTTIVIHNLKVNSRN